MALCKKDTIRKYIPIILVGIVMFILLQRVNLLPPSDDTESGRKVIEMGMFSWLKFRIFNWQPRLYSDVIFAIFVQVPIVFWRIANAIVVTLLLLIITKVSNIKLLDEKKMEQSIFIGSCFFFYHPML